MGSNLELFELCYYADTGPVPVANSTQTMDAARGTTGYDPELILFIGLAMFVLLVGAATTLYMVVKRLKARSASKYIENLHVANV